MNILKAGFRHMVQNQIKKYNEKIFIKFAYRIKMIAAVNVCHGHKK